MDRTEEPMHVPERLPKPPEKGGAGRTVLIVVIVLLILAAIGAAIWAMAKVEGLSGLIRDIAIITAALVTIVIGAFLAILVFQLQSLISLLRHEVRPILDSTKQTVSTVRGTTTFVSDNVVSPMINVMSVVAGIGQTARTLVRGPGHSSNGRGRRRSTNRS